MIKNSKITGNDFIIKNRTGRNVNPFPVISDNNDGPFKTTSFPK